MLRTLAALLACSAAAIIAHAQPQAHPDFTGVWQIQDDAVRTFDSTVKRSDDQVPPYNATWMAEWKKMRDRARAGMKVWDPSRYCLPPGMPRTMVAFYPLEILETPGRLTLLTEFFNETRRIWMDGRSHPAGDDLEPTFSGHSIGHWEGDTLVIDTVGLRYETVLDLTRLQHSDQMHIIERVRLVHPDELAWEITLEDPVVFERPWTGTRHLFRAPPGTEVREFVCSDGNQPDRFTPSPDDALYDRQDPRLKTLP